MGRRPKAESDEFRIFTFYSILVIEIFAILCLKPLKKCYIVWEHDPATMRAKILVPGGVARARAGGGDPPKKVPTGQA